MNARTKDMSDIESILKKNDINGSRWYPKEVSAYRNCLFYGLLANLDHSYRSNIVYSLQYIEYLDIQLAELNLSSVICSMVIKSYIITAASIIEILFFEIAKANKKINTINWEKVKSEDKKTTNIGNGYRILTSEITQKKLLCPIIESPKFDSLISIVKDNKLLKDLDLIVLNRFIKEIRLLRNKIHLTTATNSKETDYYRFSGSDYLRTKYILYKILTDSTIHDSNKENIFNLFLKRSIKQINLFKKERIYRYG